MKVIVSLTSIPRRFDAALPRAVESLTRQSLPCQIVVNIPREYRKWGAVSGDDLPAMPDGVTIHRPSRDYGPATKLLGAIEYARGKAVSHIVTVDDDIVLSSPHYLRYLIACASIAKGCAVTVGGIRLDHAPFRNGDGLTYGSKFTFVDSPAGYLGVVYPAGPLLASRLPFDLSGTLPPGTFNDDDAYFGAVLHQLGVPLLAIPKFPGKRNREAEGSGPSAVAEQAQADRVENESAIFSAAVAHGVIKVNRPQRGLSASERARLFWTWATATF